MAKSNVMSMDEVNEKLDKGLEDIFKNERFQEMLKVMSKFRNYSINNSIMIMIQNPNATMVKGFRSWQELGRNVNKGEKSIKILAPSIKNFKKIDEKTQKPILKPDGKPETEKKIVGFRPVSVFDVAQTDGKEIPNVRDFVSRDLQDDNSMGDLYKTFMDHINKEGTYSVREDITDSGVGGHFTPSSNEIVVSNTENVNDTEKFRVLVHEYAHAKLHNLEGDFKDVGRGHKEAQAESVAYVVSNYYGVETDDVSLGYIATWSQDVKLAKQALSEIQSVSNEMVDVLDDLQQDKIHEFYQDNSKTYNQVKEDMQGNFGVDLDTLKKSEPSVEFEILQKDRGNVLSARLEHSEKTDKFQFRLNNNRIVPLDEFNKDGNYALLNKEIINGKNVTLDDSYTPVSDFKYEQLDNGNYAVLDNNDNKMSNEFDTESLALKQLDRTHISQALHHESFLKSQGEPTKEVEQRLEHNTMNLNYKVGRYLTLDRSDSFVPKGDGGTTIGWTLMKRPNIQNIDDLNDYVNDTKHLPSNEKLRSAMDNARETERDNNKEETKEHSLELS